MVTLLPVARQTTTLTDGVSGAHALWMVLDILMESCDVLIYGTVRVEHRFIIYRMYDTRYRFYLFVTSFCFVLDYDIWRCFLRRSTISWTLLRCTCSVDTVVSDIVSKSFSIDRITEWCVEHRFVIYRTAVSIYHLSYRCITCHTLVGIVLLFRFLRRSTMSWTRLRCTCSVFR